MPAGPQSLTTVYDGWDGYQTSLIKAIAPLTREQLAWRAAPDRRSVGEIARHISLGRLTWFLRMDAPGSTELARQVDAWKQDQDGNRHVVEEAAVDAENAADLVRWLEATSTMVADTLAQWTVADLAQSYRHTYWGKTYAVSRQWTIWRIMAHDIHHGGQLTILLAMQGIEPPDLGALGGHITEPPIIST